MNKLSRSSLVSIGRDTRSQLLLNNVTVNVSGSQCKNVNAAFVGLSAGFFNSNATLTV
jgi:hypothetical protein